MRKLPTIQTNLQREVYNVLRHFSECALWGVLPLWGLRPIDAEQIPNLEESEGIILKAGGYARFKAEFKATEKEYPRNMRILYELAVRHAHCETVKEIAEKYHLCEQQIHKIKKRMLTQLAIRIGDTRVGTRQK